MSLKALQKDLSQHSSREKAKVLQRFFKTGPGEYAEGDIFIGVKVPEIRTVAKKYQDLGLAETSKLLKSKIHEERLTALLILVLKYRQAAQAEQKKIYNLYLKSTKYIDNWDLIDLTAEHIVGSFLINKTKAPLYKLARSQSLWERRIAILATFHYIKQNQFKQTLTIARMLINDREDLIHKAVGWMLRETGKRHLASEHNFLKKHYKKMPRTMLRYAIEKFSESTRQAYLKGTIT